MPDTCYTYQSGQIIPGTGWVENNGFDDTCCASPDDKYLQHGLCYSPNSNLNKITYYVAGCTDPTYKNKDCPQYCKTEKFPGVKWQNGTTWACCGVNPVGQPDCGVPSSETFTAPSQADLDNYRNSLDKVEHGAKLALGAIIGIIIACVVVAALCCFCLFRCFFSRKARDKRSRGKFAPIGGQRGGEDIWNANVNDHNQGHELHDGPQGNYGYGNQAPYHPPNQAGPKYTVGSFR